MQLTRVRLCHNKLREFKYRWMLGRKRKLRPARDLDYFKSLGIPISQPEEVLSDVLPRLKKEDYIPTPAPPPAPLAAPLHRVGAGFTPLLGLGAGLAQRLTHTAAKEGLPPAVTRRQRAVVAGDAALFQENIIGAHLLDNCEDRIKDPQNFELPNKLERKAYYGIPAKRKNELLTSALLDTFDATGVDPLALSIRPRLSNVRSDLLYSYNDALVHVSLPVALHLSAPAPLAPFSTTGEADLFVAPPMDDRTRRKIQRRLIEEEKGGPLQQPLPDCGPVEPYIGADILDDYDSVESRPPHPRTHPHTLHLHHNCERLTLHQEQLTALTLLHLHAAALTYALTHQVPVSPSGLLSRPVVVQAAHSHLNLFQAACFQLNTLGPFLTPLRSLTVTSEPSLDPSTPVARSSHTSPYPHLSSLLPPAQRNHHTRNVFLHTPFTPLFSKAELVGGGRPTLTGFSAGVVAVLRALHEAGLE